MYIALAYTVFQCTVVFHFRITYSIFRIYTQNLGTFGLGLGTKSSTIAQYTRRGHIPVVVLYPVTYDSLIRLVYIPSSSKSNFSDNRSFNPIQIL